MSTGRGQRTTIPPPKGTFGRAAAGELIPVDDDEDAFDRPTIVPTVPPDELAAALASGDELDVGEDSAILRRGGMSQPRIPAIDPPTPPPSSTRQAQPSLGDEIDLWGGGSRVPSVPPRSQMPTIAEADPLSFDIAFSAPPPTRRLDHEELELDLSPPPVMGADAKRRANTKETQPDLAGRRNDNAISMEGNARSPVSSRARTGSGGPAVEMRDRFALGDFTGALVLGEALLEQDPSNAEAARYVDSCRERLRQMYAARLGSLDRVPRVVIPPDQVRWLSLDHRAGFVLSCVDGYSTIDEVLDVSGMPALDALRVLYELLQQRIISVA